MVGDAEQTRIHPLLQVVPEQPFVRTAETARTREPADRLVAPAVALRDGLLDDLAFAEEPPEIFIRSETARHPVGVADDGDGIAGCT